MPGVNRPFPGCLLPLFQILFAYWFTFMQIKLILYERFWPRTIYKREVQGNCIREWPIVITIWQSSRCYRYQLTLTRQQFIDILSA